MEQIRTNELKSDDKYLIKYVLDPSNTKYLNEFDETKLKQIIPFLVRLWYRSKDNYNDIKNATYKQQIFRKIAKYKRANDVCFYLSADFTHIHDDIISHLSLR